MIDDNSIITALVALLDDITEVEEVYGGIPNTTVAYPYIAIRPNGWSETYSDLRDNEITATYVIGVYANIADDTLVAQTTLRGIVKQVHEILTDQDNIELGGLIDYSALTTGQYLFDQKDASLYYCEIEYRVQKKVSRYS